ncbi:MAG: ABC transporter permease [Caldisericia bacterium]|jgi:ABC-2 type transport system permease protein|nr:ABC transporter permease [Caldisericia bacterium]
MKTLKELIKIDFKLLLREFVVVFFSIIFPVAIILMMGGIYGNKPTPYFGGFGSIDVMVPSYLGIVLAVNGLMSLPLTLVEYRDKKILKRYMATPLKPIYVIISQIVVNFILTLIGFILLYLVGKSVFDLKFYGNIFLFSISFIFSTLSLFSIGFIIASLVSNPRTANTIAYIIYFPMLFLSGSTIPLENFPKFMLFISKFLPLTYIVDLFKRTWLNSDISWIKINLSLKLDFLVIILIMIVSLIVSLLTFKWYYD